MITINALKSKSKIAAFCAVVVLLSIPSVTAVQAKPIILINLHSLAQIESSGNPRAYNRRTRARGLYQITPICLKEYNKIHRTHYRTGDLYNPEVNKKIADWYLCKRIPQLLKHYKLPVTLETILICYNAGISFLKHNKPLPRETRFYIKKYRDLVSL